MDANEKPMQPSPLQFSLRHLLLLTTAVGAAAGLVCAPPSWPTLVAIELLATFFATNCVVAASRNTGRLRSFWLAMAVPCVLAAALPIVAHPIFLWIGPQADHGYYTPQLAVCVRMSMTQFWLFAPLNAAACLLIRHVCSADP
jgi:hypothetical protein